MIFIISNHGKMKKRLILVRHVESMKNTLHTFSAVDGKEPITKYGRYQAQKIADYIYKICNDEKITNPSIFSAADVRSVETANKIANKLNVNYETKNELSSYTSNITSGKIISDMQNDNSDFYTKINLYRSGLLSAYEVPWFPGTIKKLENKLNLFLSTQKLLERDLSVIVSHKSVITCLSLAILKKIGKYPKNFYGYIDIPVGNGFLFEFNNEKCDYTLLNFGQNEKKGNTDVTLVNGTIVFPESVCAICWMKGSLLLVRQLRHDAFSWELPGGKISADEPIVLAAERELQEETGYFAKDGKVIRNVDLDLSVSYHKTYLVKFNEFSQIGAGELEHKWIPSKVISEMINKGEITHAPTIIAFLTGLIEKGKDKIC